MDSKSGLIKRLSDHCKASDWDDGTVRNITNVDNVGNNLVDCADKTTTEAKGGAESQALSPEVLYPSNSGQVSRNSGPQEQYGWNKGEEDKNKTVDTLPEHLVDEKTKVLYSKSEDPTIRLVPKKPLYEAMLHVDLTKAGRMEERKINGKDYGNHCTTPEKNSQGDIPVKTFPCTNQSLEIIRPLEKNHKLRSKVSKSRRLTRGKKLLRASKLHKNIAATDERGFRLLDGVIWGTCIGMAIGALWGA